MKQGSMKKIFVKQGMIEKGVIRETGHDREERDS